VNLSKKTLTYQIDYTSHRSPQDKHHLGEPVYQDKEAWACNINIGGDSQVSSCFEVKTSDYVSTINVNVSKRREILTYTF